MKKDIKKLWIKALTSGKFKQTRGLLKDDKGHCCLGVLCELYLDEYTETTWKDLDTSLYETESGDALPEEVREWADLRSDNPRVNFGGYKDVEISEFNDGSESDEGYTNKIKSRTFKQIANIIDKNL